MFDRENVLKKVLATLAVSVALTGAALAQAKIQVGCTATSDCASAMRLSLTVALILSVVCEILAGLDGLGHWVLLSARAFRSADLFAGVILLGVTGYVTSVAMSLAEHRLLAWQAAQR